MKWLRILIILISIPLLAVLLYVANYIRLSYLPPKPVDQRKSIAFNTEHSVSTTKVCIPKNTNIDGFAIRISTDIPGMGVHYFILTRLFAGDDLPKGYMVHNHKIVGYFYSNHDQGCQIHIHRNLCLMEGLVATTRYNRWQCLMRGYFFFPRDDWMLHVFIGKSGWEANEEFTVF